MLNKKFICFAVITLLNFHTFARSSESTSESPTQNENPEPAPHEFPPFGSDPITWTPEWLLEEQH